MKPRRNVGDWLFNPLTGENQRVVSVDRDSYGVFRLNLPGYGAPEASVYGPLPDAPFVECQTSNGYSWSPAIHGPKEQES